MVTKVTPKAVRAMTLTTRAAVVAEGITAETATAMPAETGMVTAMPAEMGTAGADPDSQFWRRAFRP